MSLHSHLLIFDSERAIFLKATKTFQRKKIKTAKDGKKHVGVAVRRESIEISHMTALVNEWIYQLKFLLKIAESEPQFA